MPSAIVEAQRLPSLSSARLVTVELMVIGNFVNSCDFSDRQNTPLSVPA